MWGTNTTCRVFDSSQLSYVKSVNCRMLKSWMVSMSCFLTPSHFTNRMRRILMNWWIQVERKYETMNLSLMSWFIKRSSSFLVSSDRGKMYSIWSWTSRQKSDSSMPSCSRMSITSPLKQILVVRALLQNYICRVRVLRCSTIKVTEDLLFLKPGTTRSAYLMVGAMKLMYAPFTNRWYWQSTPSTVLPLSSTSLLILRHSLTSSEITHSLPSQLMKILYFIRSLILRSYKEKIPSKMITSVGSTLSFSESLECVTKQQRGTSAVSPLMRAFNTSYALSKSNASGWSKLQSSALTRVLSRGLQKLSRAISSTLKLASKDISFWMFSHRVVLPAAEPPVTPIRILSTPSSLKVLLRFRSCVWSIITITVTNPNSCTHQFIQYDELYASSAVITTHIQSLPALLAITFRTYLDHSCLLN